MRTLDSLIKESDELVVRYNKLQKLIKHKMDVKKIQLMEEELKEHKHTNYKRQSDGTVIFYTKTPYLRNKITETVVTEQSLKAYLENHKELVEYCKTFYNRRGK